MKKFEKLGYVALGAIVALAISYCAVPAFAAAMKTISVTSDLTVYVNDSEYHYTDAAGNEVEPFIYNGSTYLPVRAVSEALNIPIEWDGSTRGVYIGTHKDSKGTSLRSLDFFNASSTVAGYSSLTNVQDNMGNTYAEAYYVHDSMNYSPWMTYNLDAQYSTLSGEFFIRHDYRASDKEQSLNIYGDDVLLYSATIKKGDTPVHFDVDVSGVLQLTVKTGTNASSLSFPEEHYGLANVKLYA